MHYLIDANNLAGALHLLDEPHFDRKLIGLIQEYGFGRRDKYILIFDSGLVMGDKYVSSNVTVIYTPKDGYYKSADDKIYEQARSINENEIFTLVTDDIDLANNIEKLNSSRRTKIIFLKARKFAALIINKVKKPAEDNEAGEEGIDQGTLDDITEEFKKIWK